MSRRQQTHNNQPHHTQSPLVNISQISHIEAIIWFQWWDQPGQKGVGATTHNERGKQTRPKDLAAQQLQPGPSPHQLWAWATKPSIRRYITLTSIIYWLHEWVGWAFSSAMRAATYPNGFQLQVKSSQIPSGPLHSLQGEHLVSKAEDKYKLHLQDWHLLLCG